jgi:RHS repeat-associated protein
MLNIVPRASVFQFIQLCAQLLRQGRGLAGLLLGLLLSSLHGNVLAANGAAPNGTPAVTANMVAGETYQISIPMKNTGTLAWTVAGNYALVLQNPAGWNISQISVGTTIAPNAGKSFIASMVAPLQAGTYNFQWCMAQGGAQFGTCSTPISITVAPRVQDAQFYSQSMPLKLTTSTHSITVSMKNTGNVTWKAGRYSMGTTDTAWGITKLTLSSNVIPNGLGTFTGTITAPAPGNYNMTWQMLDPTGHYFGTPSDALTVAVAGAAPALSVLTPTANQTFIGTSGTIQVPIHAVATPTGVATINSVKVQVYDSSAQKYDVLATADGPELDTTVKLRAVNMSLVVITTDSFNKASSVSIPIVAKVDGAQLTMGVPNSMVPGQQYNITITAKNIGSTTWDPQTTRLVPFNAAQISNWGDFSLPLTSSVPPGETATFTTTVTAPANEGRIAFQMIMNENTRANFGAVGSVLVSLAHPSPTVSLTSPITAESVEIPTKTTAQVRVQGVAIPGMGATISKLELLDGPTALVTLLDTAKIDQPVELSPGAHQLRLRATDNWGKVALSTFVAFTVKANDARFMVQSVPLTMQAGKTYATSVDMSNTGTKPWTAAAGYALVSDNPTVWGISRVEPTTMINPNVGQTFRIPLTAPSVPGTYTYQWHMVQDGVETFGDTTKSLEVVVKPAAPTVPSLTAPLAGDKITTEGGKGDVHLQGSATAGAGGTISLLEVLDGVNPIASIEGDSIDTVVQLAPGTHILKMRATDNFGQVVTGTATTSIAVLTNNAAVVSRSAVPATMDGGASYPVTVIMRNVGTNTWTAADGYALAPVQDDDTWAPHRIPVSGSIAYNGTASFTFNVTAPPAGGSYPLQWQMLQEGKGAFGAQTAALTVAVTNELPTATLSRPKPLALTTFTTTGSTAQVLVEGTAIAVGNATIAKLEVMDFGKVLYTVNGNTLSATVPLDVGKHWLGLRATDSRGYVGVSTGAVIVVTQVSVPVPVAALAATPENQRVAPGQSANITLTGSGASQGALVSKLEVFVDNGSGYGVTPVKTVTGSAAQLALKDTITLENGSYRLKLRATDNNGSTAESAVVQVNITNSPLLGLVEGVRTSGAQGLQLVGWTCRDTSTEALNYQVFVNAPQALGGTLVASGVANVGSELEDAAVQQLCHSPGASHHFTVDLTSLQKQYPGAPLYVSASSARGEGIVLPCDDHSCAIPNGMRIGLTSPNANNLDRFRLPMPVFARAVVTGFTGTLDEVSFNINGEWLPATAEGSGAYSVSRLGLQASSAPYLAYAKVRQGETTLITDEHLFYVDPGVVPGSVLPPDGTVIALNQPTVLSTVVNATVEPGQTVKFLIDPKVAQLKTVQTVRRASAMKLAAVMAAPVPVADAPAVSTGGSVVGTATFDGNKWNYTWTPDKEGSYTVVAKLFDGSGAVLMATPAVTLTARANVDPTGSAPSPVLLEPPHLLDTDAGTLPGQLEVGNDGAATYRIPIVVPPGTAGMQPALSINYTSNGSNGTMGLGWSLGGLSTIHRCGKTIAQDGMPGRISFDTADRLCLDGQRLLRADGANPGSDVSAVDAAYWAAGAQYRTEQESFSRITRLANGGFKVEAKDGHIRYYGIDAGSAILAQGRGDGQTLVWALARAEDRMGNAMTVSYTQDATTGEYLPSQVSYGGNASQTADLAVRFSYEAREDAQLMYMGGSRNDLRSRLIHVQTFYGTAADGSGGTPVRDYNVHYTLSANSGRSLVDWIQVCARNQNSRVNDCLPKTSFDWGVGGSISYHELPTKTVPVFVGSFMEKGFIGNLDGRGTSVAAANIVQLCYQGTKPCDHHASDEDRIGYKIWDGQLLINLPDGSQISRTLRFPNGVSPDLVTGVLVGDLDGDGRDDLVLTSTIPGFPAVAGYCLTVPANGSIDFKCTQWWGYMASNSSEGSLPSMVDLRNEHKMHLIFGTSANVAQPNDCFYDAASGTMKCQDFAVTDVTPPTSPYGNLPDQPYFQVAGIDLSKQDVSDFYSVWKNSGSTTTYQGVTLCWNKRTVLCQNVYQGVRDISGTNTAPLPSLFKILNVGDLNGDGLTDFIYVLDNQSYLCLSTENGVNCQPAQGLGGNGTFKGLAIGDFAGDGANQVLVDALVNGVVQPYLLCRLHDGQFQCQGITGLPSDVAVMPSAAAPGPIGTPKFSFDTGIYANPSNRTVKSYTLAGPAESDKLIGVTNGVGQREEVNYARGDDTSVYRIFAQIDGVEQRPVYPLVSAPPGILARQLRRSNGQGAWLSNGYFYEGAASDAHGRGSSGFAQITSTDLQTGFYTVTALNQNFPYVGMAQRSRTYAGNVLLADTQNTPDQQALTFSSGAQSVFAYTSKSVVVRKDLDGSDLGSTATENQYRDGWGNLTQQNIVVSGGGQSFSSQSTMTFKNDADAWLLGLPAAVALTKTDELGRKVTRNTSATYYPTTGLLATETIEPDDSQYQFVTTYDRSGNAFGLVNTKTQAWFDPATQSNVTRMLSDTRYDARGRFISTVTNALGHMETHSYDPGTGVRVKLIDPNELPTSWEADGFGRVKKEVRADGNEARQYFKLCKGDCPAGAAVVQILDTFNGGVRTSAPQLTYSDSAGHVLRTQTWGFDGRQIVTDKTYDERGRLYETDQPRFVNDPVRFASRLFYDDLNRVLKTVTLDDAGHDSETTVSYQGLLKTIRNPLLQTRKEGQNVLGKVILVDDADHKSTAFTYDPFGNLRTTMDPNHNPVEVTYDKWGRKTDLRDPDLGWIHYDVDPLSQVWAQTSPNQRAAGTKTTFKFDLLGRMVARYEPDLESHWKFDTAAMGKGMLAEAYTMAGEHIDYDRVLTYDALSRPSQVTQTLTDGSYSSTTAYDSWGRTIRQTYQRGSDAAKAYDLRYNGNGYLARLERAGLVLWSATSEDAALRQTVAALGNGLTRTQQFNPYVGYLDSGTLAFTASGNVQLQEGYQYDALGNVLNRTAYWGAGPSQVGFAEGFTYDSLNRLKTSSMTGQPIQNFYYDALGNVTGKTNVGRGIDGDYSYIGGSGGPHAIKSIAGVDGTFSYDLNGNQIEAPGRTASWTSFDMPLQLAKGDVTGNFVYGPEHQRVRQSRKDGSSSIYAGAQETEVKDDVTTVRTYWPMGIGFETDKLGSTQLYWVHHDRIGSVVAITDANGKLVESTAYDAWGKRRDLTSNATPDTLDGVIDNKGYTGHEMLDQLDLVHMNGRVYDPLTAKFLSGDPLVQDPTNGQNYNRYSYVLNNPTNLTDPTGFANDAPSEKPDVPKQDLISRMEGFAISFFNSSTATAATRAETTSNANSAASNPENSANSGTPSVVGAKAATATDGSALGQLDIPKVIVQGYRRAMADFADNNRGIYGWGWAVGLTDRYFQRPDQSAEGKVAGVLLFGLSMRSPRGAEAAIAKEIRLSRSIHGEAAIHAADAIEAGAPSVLTIDRLGAPANRNASIGALDKVPGMHLDEYPPAMFREGGSGASVRAINPRDNMSAGACIGNACRGLPDGSKVRITVGD